MQYFVTILTAVSTVIGGAAAVIRAEHEDRSRVVFLVLVGLLAGGVLYAILTYNKDHSDLNHPLWWVAFLGVSVLAGLAGGLILRAQTSALLPGGFVWLAGTMRMNYYAIDQQGDKLLSWHPSVTAYPWVSTWFALLPVCPVLSFVAAWLVNGRKVGRAAEQRPRHRQQHGS